MHYHRRCLSKRSRRITAVAAACALGIVLGFFFTSVARMSLLPVASPAATDAVVSDVALASECADPGDWRPNSNDPESKGTGSWSYSSGVVGNLFLRLYGDRSPSSDKPGTPETPWAPNGSEDRCNLIFVGVMTAQKYLDSRALAVHRTWARTVPGRVVFFAGAEARAPPGLPVVRLPGVDDSYPPQKKSFLMFKWMHDHVLDRYEWFMRADDDVFVRGDRLAALLRSVNSSRPQFIGQAGMGNKEEFGQLYLEQNANFCMGGPGIVVSRETLARFAPHVRDCLKNLYSTHEDVEIGRCVRKFAGIPCTWSYEMQSIFYHNSSGSEAFTGNLNQKEVHRSITLHPVKQHQHIYRLHNYFQSLRIQDMRQKTLQLHRDIRAMQEGLHAFVVLPSGLADPSPQRGAALAVGNASSVTMEPIYENFFGNSLELGKGPCLNKFYPSDDSEVLKWEFIQRILFSHTSANPRRKFDHSLRVEVDDLVIQVMEMINKFSKQRGRIIDFKEILYGYRRVNPHHGADYILDLHLVYKKYRGRKLTIPVRKHVYLQQVFAELEVRELPVVGDGSFADAPLPDEHERSRSQIQLEPEADSGSREDDRMRHSVYRYSDSRTINFVLPLSGRLEVFRRFARNFERTCLSVGDSVSLTVVLFPFADGSGPSVAEGERMVADVTAVLDDLRDRYRGPELRVKTVGGYFSRALALELGSALLQPDQLLFFVDVDMTFDRHFLNRVRANTVQGRQVFYPVVFSQFDPTVSGHVAPEGSALVFSVDDDLGYWRQFGYGIVSLYHSDLGVLGGLDTTIQGWGKEDVDLYEKAVRSNLTVFRSADPGLVHVFHPVVCDPRLSDSQMVMCLGSRASSFAAQRRLSEMVYADDGILRYVRERKAPAVDAKKGGA